MKGAEVTNNGMTFDAEFPDSGGVFGRRTTVLIRDNVQITNNTGAGMWFRDNTASEVSSSVSITGNDYGVLLEAGSGVRVSGAAIAGNSPDDIFCKDPTNWVAGDTSGVAKIKQCEIVGP